MVEVTGWKSVGAKLMDYAKAIQMHWEGAPPADQQQPELFND